MYKAYFKETENLETYENEAGMFGYTICDFSKTIDIGYVYINQEYRNGVHYSNLFKDMIKIATDRKCKRVSCCVITSNHKPETPMYMLLRHKFKFSHITGDVIYFYLDI